MLKGQGDGYGQVSAESKEAEVSRRSQERSSELEAQVEQARALAESVRRELAAQLQSERDSAKRAREAASAADFEALRMILELDGVDLVRHAGRGPLRRCLRRTGTVGCAAARAHVAACAVPQTHRTSSQLIGGVPLEPLVAP